LKNDFFGPIFFSLIYDFMKSASNKFSLKPSKSKSKINTSRRGHNLLQLRVRSDE